MSLMVILVSGFFKSRFFSDCSNARFDYLRDNMAMSPKDLVQRRHNYAIVDEVDSVLIDDARTPLIISGPVAKGDDQLFEQYQPLVERLVEVQRKLATQYLAEAKQLINSGDKEKEEQGFLQLFRSHKALPKNNPLIKFLSETGVKAGMLKTEEIFYNNFNYARIQKFIFLSHCRFYFKE